MKINEELKRKYDIIEFGLHIQRAIEILDDLDIANHPMKNKKLNQQLKGVYGVLDKETRLYNELHKVSANDTTFFYDTVKQNSKFIMQHHLLDKSLICSFLVAHEQDKKAVEGIINKVLKGQ